ncbi:DUF4097 family beta strand repeat-containing protein [Terrabacter sp. LjRoot27]|uniref:DUF4097 family beta strand repeat-containing protein n=1 Tax=Terrabacter sp. LjRoot27 TaxID=3342306 RepID=UPI003ED0ACEF
MSVHDPTNPQTTQPSSVPDDRVHGDSLPGAEPYGDSWLRPTLTAEPAVGAPAGSPGGPNGAGGGPATPSARPWWLLAGLGATLVLAGAAGVTTWGAATGGLWRSVDQHQTYEQPVGALTIRGGASDIEVRGGGAAGTVQVSRHLSWGPGSSEPTPREQWTGTTLTVDAECRGLVAWCSVDYVVVVPDAADVTVDTGSGDITLTGSLGGVTLKAGSGDIETADLGAEQVTAEAGSGDIDVELASAVSPVSLRTGSGEVSVRLPQDAVYAVDTETGSGDTEVSVPTNPGSTTTLRIRTGSGDIAVDAR